MADLNDERLAALEALEKAARPAPWSVLYGYNVVDADGGSAFSKLSNVDPSFAETNAANAALTVAARNALPSLLAEVRALRGENAALSDRIEELERVLRVVLPMARGWAAEHRVRRNDEMIEWATAALAGVRALREGESDG